MRLFLRYWLLVLAQMAFIFYLSSRSSFPVEMPWWAYQGDKVVHMGLYGLLGFLFLRAWLRGALADISFNTSLVTIAFAAGYGLTDEFHQMFVPYRTADLLDVTADAVGATLVCVLVYFFFKSKNWRTREQSN